jgi:SAM-dependent methyltransferase
MTVPTPRRVAGALYRRAKVVRWYARKTRFGLEWLRDVAIDWKYGGYCGGRIGTKFPETGAHGTSSADYYQLEKLFSPGGLEVGADDVLVDVGCGKGRILNFWLHRGFRNRMYGLELDPEIAAWAGNRLRKFSNVHVIAGDAVANLPADATAIFLFNPFAASVMELFKRRVKEMFHGSPVRILYFHCKSAHVFENDPDFHVRELRLNTFYRAVLITMRQKSQPLEVIPNATNNAIA